MVFNLAEVEANSVDFDEVRNVVFKGLAPAMQSMYKGQRYFMQPGAATGAAGTPGTITRMVVVFATSAVAAHPRQAVYLPPGFVVVGGGARDNWSGSGNLLTGSYPLFGTIHGWEGEGKDHEISDPASITVWAIGMQIEGLNPLQVG